MFRKNTLTIKQLFMTFQFVNEMIDFRTPSGITGQPNGSRLGYIQFSSPNKTSIRIHLPEFDDVFYLNDEIQSQAYDHGNYENFKTLFMCCSYVTDKRNASEKPYTCFKRKQMA